MGCILVKKFILNVDDLGREQAINRAVLEGFQGGILKSAGICANGKYFDEAINSVVKSCDGLGVGIHLNITSGKSLCTDLAKLTDEDMNFNNNFFKLLFKAYNPKEKEFLEEVEREFRRQIEKVLSVSKISHIDSHNHIHAIPPIFDIVCRLAQEYRIKYVRTHFEKFYIVPDIYKHMNKMFFINTAKKFMLNLLTVFNENTVHKYGLKTNDYLLGLSYADEMDSRVVSYGLSALKYDNITVECIIHPCRYEEGTINNRFDEYLLARNPKLKNKIEKLGYEITNYVEEEN